MTPRLRSVIDRILDHEGGIADVGDGKGETRFGQTPEWLAANYFTAPSTRDEAAVNYDVWMKRKRLAEIAEIDPAVGYMVMDYAVHSGTAKAIKALQSALGVKADGVFGPITKSALLGADPNLVAHKVYAERLRWMGRHFHADPEDAQKFAHGWLNRMADLAEALA